MTRKELLKYGEKLLKMAGIEEAVLDAWLLFSWCINLSRTQYFLTYDKAVTREEQKKFGEAIQKREKRIPVQQITGTQEFMGFPFLVTNRVLIPRQDTECLTELVLKEAAGKEVLDLCTGSGCIIISLSKMASLKRAVGSDISADALVTANKNKELLDAPVEFIQGNLFENVKPAFDIIVSNPPYIKTAVIETLQPEVSLYEPRIALDGREDGLYFYKSILKKAPEFLRDNGQIFFEIGSEQGSALLTLFQETGFKEGRIQKDLAGLDRIAQAVWKN